MQFNLVRREGNANITAVIDGELYPADDAHPNFDDLVQAAVDGDEEAFLALYDASIKVAEVFADLTDRVVVRNSRVWIDQNEVNDVYADTIVKFVQEEVDSAAFSALVNFLEKVYSNVDADVRENLSRWLKAEDFTILPNGNILGYRGLNSDYTSVHAGPGIVNGERVNGHLDNSVGNVVEIDNDLVEVNPSIGCAPGLHVGTYAYAQGWARGAVVSVEVDPRHVRSVPYECNDSKMRVSRYKVLDTITSKTDDSVSYEYVDDDDYDYDAYDEYDYY